MIIDNDNVGILIYSISLCVEKYFTEQSQHIVAAFFYMLLHIPVHLHSSFTISIVAVILAH